MRAIFFTALLAVLLPLSSAAQGLGPPRPQRLEGNAQLQRFLLEGREVSISGLDDEGEPPLYMPRLYRMPAGQGSCGGQRNTVCGFRYYLALSGAGTRGRPQIRAVYDLGILGDVTRAEYRGTNGSEPFMLRITVLNLPRWTLETDRPPARQQAVYDIVLGPTLRVVRAR
jgi:hypothetical protein